MRSRIQLTPSTDGRSQEIISGIDREQKRIYQSYHINNTIHSIIQETKLRYVASI